jgi:arginine N-succinyltransferase
MLKKVGFQYKNQVDPFDGGPHFWANIDEVLPIKKIKPAVLMEDSVEEGQAEKVSGLLCSSVQRRGEFRAMSTHCLMQEGRLFMSAPDRMEAMKILHLELGDAVTFMPYY